VGRRLVVAIALTSFLLSACSISGHRRPAAAPTTGTNPTSIRGVSCDTTNSGTTPTTNSRATDRASGQRFRVLSTQVDGPFFNVSVNARGAPRALGYFTDHRRQQYVLLLKATTLRAGDLGYHPTSLHQAWIAS
jgi:hypothetical protein